MNAFVRKNNFMSSPGVFQYFPTGFRIPIGDGVRPEVTADSEVMDLWTLFQNDNSATLSWDFHKRVIKAAKRLFGNYPLWVIAQEGNPQLSLAQNRLIKDTSNFILRGRRLLSLDSHEMLIGMERGSSKSVKFDDTLRDDMCYRNTDLIASWVRQSNGVYDLLYTLRLMFGSLPTTIV